MSEWWMNPNRIQIHNLTGGRPEVWDDLDALRFMLDEVPEFSRGQPSALAFAERIKVLEGRQERGPGGLGEGEGESGQGALVGAAVVAVVAMVVLVVLVMRR